MRILLSVIVVGICVASSVLTYGRNADTPEEAPALVGIQHEGHGGDGGPTMKIEFENDLVQVIRIRIGPHEKLPMHDVTTPRVLVLLTDEHLRITLHNGETREISAKAGETSWLEPQKHEGQNLSDSPIEFIAVVAKRK
jgi:quercetin dioxygenase-like cupin family protein